MYRNAESVTRDSVTVTKKCIQFKKILSTLKIYKITYLEDTFYIITFEILLVFIVLVMWVLIFLLTKTYHQYNIPIKCCSVNMSKVVNTKRV